MTADNPAPKADTLGTPQSSFRFPKVTKTLILAVFFVAAIALNIATVTVGAVFNTMSSLVGSAAALITTKNVTVRSVHKGRLAALRANKKLLSKRVRSTTARVTRRIATATARSTGSVAAESIPYAGIGMILAVTAWEVKDSCETMNDLHELNVAFNPDVANDPDHEEVCGAQVAIEGRDCHFRQECTWKGMD